MMSEYADYATSMTNIFFNALRNVTMCVASSWSKLGSRFSESLLDSGSEGLILLDLTRETSANSFCQSHELNG